MKAVVYRKNPGVLSCENIPDPCPGAGQALVRVKNVGVCGSDLFFFKSGMMRDGCILGHEVSGVVAGVGEGVEGWAPGDRVLIRPAGCGKCPYCARREENLCPSRRAVGMLQIPGGYAEFIAADADMLIRIPEGLGFPEAALTDPLATSLHALRTGGFKRGDSALVVGAGPVGLATILFLKKEGARPAIAIEPSPKRLDLAREMGAELALPPDDRNLREKIREAAGIDGPQFVFECSGVPSAFQQALGLVARGGKLLILSVCPAQTPIIPLQLMQNQVSIAGSFGDTHDECLEVMRAMADGGLNADVFLTDPCSLEDLPGRFMRLLENKDEIKLMASCGD